MHQKWREAMAQKKKALHFAIWLQQPDMARFWLGPHPRKRGSRGRCILACSLSLFDQSTRRLRAGRPVGWVSQRPDCGQGDGCNAATDGHRALEGPALPERCRTHGDGMAKAPPGEQMHRTGGKAFAHHVRPDTVPTNQMSSEHPD